MKKLFNHIFMKFLYFMEARKRDNKWGGQFTNGGMPVRDRKIDAK